MGVGSFTDSPELALDKDRKFHGSYFHSGRSIACKTLIMQYTQCTMRKFPRYMVVPWQHKRELMAKLAKITSW